MARCRIAYLLPLQPLPLGVCRAAVDVRALQEVSRHGFDTPQF
jgi:hypothetical protein